MLGFICGVILGMVVSTGLAQTETSQIVIPAGVYQGDNGISLVIGLEATPTPEVTDLPTLEPTLIQKCDIQLQREPSTYGYSDPDTNSAITTAFVPSWYEAIRFYVPSIGFEWALVKDASITGWVMVDEFVYYDINSYCVDVPTDYEATPPPSLTPSMTFTPGPTFTPTSTPEPVYMVEVYNNLESCIRIRDNHNTSGTITGSWCPGESVIVSEFIQEQPFVWGKVGYNDWTALAYTDSYSFEWWITTTGAYEFVEGWQSGWPDIPF